ncbi:major facilitator superfamily domain-containing protein [Blyttiomyces helicus]|uniref:Major facilitator superfamily domain-containing protein n=1 Tax=Blyttiomyces helicus TaxID=388810 RepID=A0A4P9W777_9FUNG|nr:major facilitator superfamily domain-containing protein [Blyttiomyces helicus]|eukprot:RKO88204.1 major facilitator superfamily domain-containing protein [Blyttiomyces helicus]
MLAVSAPKASAFAHLDDSKLGWFHLRAIIVSGVGFFGDAYDVFVIGLALPMVYRVYYPPNSGSSFADSTFQSDQPHIDALMKASTSWGNLVGQLGFGYLGDKLGRKKMYGVELIIMIIAAIGSTLSSSAVRGFGILTVLGAWRFFLGIGIGGDYPMSATITSEFAQVRNRGRMVAAVFAMQGIGILVGGLVTLIALVAFQDKIREDPLNLDYVWRIMLGFGIIPALFTVYFRLTMPESPRYKVNVEGDIEGAMEDLKKAHVFESDDTITEVAKAPVEAAKPRRVVASSFSEYFGQWKNMRVLIGTCYCWFALDIAWYGLTLNSQVVLTLINYGGTKGASMYENFYQKAVGNIIIACMGTVPGYWVTVLLIERLGRKPIQFLGFFVITIILFILAIFYDNLSSNAPVFLTLYTIAQFFFNFGPNETTFVIPSEVFPTRFRSTAHGMSAAAGKLGAIIGVQAVGPFFKTNVKICLFTFSFVMATGFLATFLLPEPKGKTLEEISGEYDEQDEVQDVAPKAEKA